MLSAHYSGNPAVDFLKKPHTGSSEQLIEQYARFLLHTSGACRLPVPLERVHRYFGFSVQDQTPLEQHGLTTEDLRIFLNADDRPTVQKFTLAHELIEIFFFALKDGAADEWMSDEMFTMLCDNKERFCDRGAAELVMPFPHFQQLAVPTTSLSPFSGPRRLQHAVRSPCLPPSVASLKHNLHQQCLLPGAISTVQESSFPRKWGKGISLAPLRRWTHQRRCVLKRFTLHPAAHSSPPTSQYLKNLLFTRRFSAESLRLLSRTSISLVFVGASSWNPARSS